MTKGCLTKRAKNIAVLKLDFKDNLIQRINVEERMSIGDKIGALGGIISSLLRQPCVNVQEELYIEQSWITFRK